MMATVTPWNVTTAAEEDSQLTIPSSFLLFSLYIAVSIFTLLGNSMTILAVFGYPELRIQPHMYVANLAIADLLVGVGVFHIAFIFPSFSRTVYHDSVYLCSVVFVLTPICGFESLLTALLMAVDRLLYIVYPFFHMKWFSEKLTKALLGVTWPFSLAAGLGPIYIAVQATNPGCGPFKQEKSLFEHILLPVNFFALNAIAFVCYGKIAHLAYKQRQKIANNFNRQMINMASPKSTGPAEVRRHRHTRLSSAASSSDLDYEPTKDEMGQLQQNEERRDQSLQCSGRSGEEGGLPAAKPMCDSRKRSSDTENPAKYQSVCLFVLVNCAFLLCCTPLFVQRLLIGVVETPEFLVGLFLFFNCSKSAVNVVILACRNKQFRRAYRSMLAKLWCFYQRRS